VLFALPTFTSRRVPGAIHAVMTGNLTKTVLSLIDMLSPQQPLVPVDRERLKSSLRLLIGFLVGCVVAAAAISVLGDWAWSMPTVLAASAIAVRLSFHVLDSYQHEAQAVSPSAASRFSSGRHRKTNLVYHNFAELFVRSIQPSFERGPRRLSASHMEADHVEPYDSQHIEE
jgi:hypothetical protein